MIDMSEVEFKNYSFEEVATILKSAGVKPNSYKEVRVIIELAPNSWLYGVTGFSKSTGIINVLVKGWETESGSQYLRELTFHRLKILVLKTPVKMMELYEEWK